MPRRKPYSSAAIHRVPCVRCGAPSAHQWQVCADGNTYRGTCIDCDIGMNTLVMRYVFGDAAEPKITAYAEKLRRQ